MAGSSLRIRRRRSVWAGFLPALRTFLSLLLLIAVVVGGIRFLTRPFGAGALDFTPHTIAKKGTAIGVNGILANDLDNDGDMDIVTGGSDGVNIYKNQGSQDYELKIIDEKKGERLQAVKIDGDDATDILVTVTDESPSVFWYRNNGDLEFDSTAIGTGRDGVAYADDIDGDGDIDVVASTKEGGDDTRTLRFWANDGSGSFTNVQTQADAGVLTISIGDIDGDGRREIVTGGNQGLQRWKTEDGFTWIRADIDDGNANKTHIVVADINGDGKTDIVTADASEDVVALYSNINNQEYRREQFSSGADAKTLVIKDLDEDGDEDIIVAGQDNNAIYWYEDQGDTGWSRTTLAEGLQSVFGLSVADIDGDNDFDFVTGDHRMGTVAWYERVRAKPTATVPSNIAQTTDGAGRILFDVTFSDNDRDSLRARIQYSTDGSKWYKPWLLKATPNKGAIDLKNSNGYQIGTSNPIDTDVNDEVKVTFIWDTKSVENTGGPIRGDVSTVRLRVIPRDSVGVGNVAISSLFRVDNDGPKGLADLTIDSFTGTDAQLHWTPASDSGDFVYSLYYGSNHADVLDRKSSAWNGDDDAAMDDREALSTTIIDEFDADTPYTFKIFATDEFGNVGAAPSTTKSLSEVVVEEPVTEIDPGVDSGEGDVVDPFCDPTDPFFDPDLCDKGDVEEDPEPTENPIIATSPSPVPSSEIIPTPTPSELPTPLVTDNNEAPVADAGPDQVVNTGALVVLDGTASTDIDGDSLTYSWKQLDGDVVDLLSARTATPSFSAGEAVGSYIFSLTVRDPLGATSVDTVTVAVKNLPVADTTPVGTDSGGEGSGGEVVVVERSRLQVIAGYLYPVDLLLFISSIISTLVLLLERLLQRAKRGGLRVGAVGATTKGSQGRVVHHLTGKPIVNAYVLVHDRDGKLRARERTNVQGAFATFFPPGEYSITVSADGFERAGTAAKTLAPENGMVYTGGMVTVRSASEPLSIVIPMKPTQVDVSSLTARALHAWQLWQRLGRAFSWPLFLLGSFLNTGLVFLLPELKYLIIEVVYVAIAITKIGLEVRTRPAYGLVRNAVTHVPLDLAVVRLFEAGTNRLVMTRVTNSQGKFFALPAPGKYTISVMKPGHAPFTKHDVEITSEQDATLQLTADLMPVQPTLASVPAAA